MRRSAALRPSAAAHRNGIAGFRRNPGMPRAGLAWRLRARQDDTRLPTEDGYIAGQSDDAAGGMAFFLRGPSWPFTSSVLTRYGRPNPASLHLEAAGGPGAGYSRRFVPPPDRDLQHRGRGGPRRTTESLGVVRRDRPNGPKSPMLYQPALWPTLPAITPVGMRAGLAGGGARNMTRYQPALTRALWVNIKAGWYYVAADTVSAARRSRMPHPPKGKRFPSGADNTVLISEHPLPEGHRPRIALPANEGETPPPPG